MTMLEAFVKERNEALFSLDRKKIEAYMIKYGETEIAQTPDVVFWASVYKAICGIKDIRTELKGIHSEMNDIRMDLSDFKDEMRGELKSLNVRIVLYCLDKQMPIDDMSLEELKQFSPVFEEDVYDAISMETCVNKRLTIGAPGEEAMKKVIAIEEAYLEKK